MAAPPGDPGRSRAELRQPPRPLRQPAAGTSPRLPPRLHSSLHPDRLTSPPPHRQALSSDDPLLQAERALASQPALNKTYAGKWTPFGSAPFGAGRGGAGSAENLDIFVGDRAKAEAEAKAAKEAEEAEAGVAAVKGGGGGWGSWLTRRPWLKSRLPAGEAAPE